MDHVGKNYNTDGGERTVIGGILEFGDGAQVKGMPGGGAGAAAQNQAESTATQVAALRSDFNSLLVKLKNAGIMLPDEWDISVRLAPSLTDEAAASNNAKASVSYGDGTVTITADVDSLEESESSDPSEGTGKWIGLGIGTGLSSVTLVSYNGTPLTAEDASEAESVGLDQAGEFVLYVRADELADTEKAITLDADGYPEITLRIVVAAPEGE